MDEEGQSSPKKTREIHINYNNDSQMAYFLDYENGFTQTQAQTQTQNDDFYEPNPVDGYIYEEPNASNTQIVLAGPVTMENQPVPVEIIHEDTNDHFQNDLRWKTKPKALAWAEEHPMKINCLLVKGRQSRENQFELICERSGTGDSKVKKGSVYVGKTGRKNGTKTKKTRCPFKIVFNLKNKNKSLNEDDEYLVMNKEMDCRHNHPRPRDLHGHEKVVV